MRAIAVLALAGSLAICLPGLEAPAVAQTDPFLACMKLGDAARGITSGIADCQHAELARKDKVLNAAYARLRQRLPRARFAALRTAQRKWILDRDRHCWRESPDAEYSGTLADLDALRCLITETEHRTEWLLRYR